MGQPTEQSRDDFKDVQEVEVLSYKNFQKKFCGEAFFGMSSLTTQFFPDLTDLKLYIRMRLPETTVRNYHGLFPFI